MSLTAAAGSHHGRIRIAAVMQVYIIFSKFKATSYLGTLPTCEIKLPVLKFALLLKMNNASSSFILKRAKDLNESSLREG